jgi:O-antigen/teichoic acid export membrane protein
MKSVEPQVEHRQSNSRIARNTLMLYLRQLIALLVGLYTSRALLSALGVTDYGIYNVVGGVVMMLGFLNGAMIGATQRFLAFDIGRGDERQLQQTFSATRYLHLGLALLIALLAETVGLWFVNAYLIIPPERMMAARWVYHFAVLSFLVTVIQVPYNALVVADERMDVFARISILEIFLKLGVVLLLTLSSLWSDRMVAYGGLLFGVSLLIALIYRIYVHRHFASARLVRVEDRSYFRTLLSYMGWNVFGNLAGVAKGQGTNVLMNLFFGPAANAARAIAMQVMTAVQAFYTNFQMASNPQIIKRYAVGQTEEMVRLVTRTSKFSLYLLALVCIPVILEMPFLQRVWLVTPPEGAVLFASLALVDCMVDCASGSLAIAMQATGRIAKYQSIVGTMILLNLPLTYIAYKLGMAVETAFYIHIAIDALALVARMILVKEKIPELSLGSFAREVVGRPLLIILLSGAVTLLLRQTMDPSWGRLIIVTLCSFVLTGGLILGIGLTSSERSYLRVVAREKLGRKR